ncbi:MAG: hypothetical protein RXR36_00910 [Nitrososphaeria archaeon]
MKVLIDMEPDGPVIFRVNLKDECVKKPGVLYLVALQTIFAIQNGELLAKKPEIDFLMRLARTDQIFLAKKICGGSDHTVYIIEKDDKNVEKISEDDINEAELSALVSAGKS